MTNNHIRDPKKDMMINFSSLTNLNLTGNDLICIFKKFAGYLDRHEIDQLVELIKSDITCPIHDCELYTILEEELDHVTFV